MNCKNCGGKLKYIDGLYICENCTSKQTITSFFENTDVYICYVEFDEQGRRTKDSIIAQALYNKLQNNNIDIFYQRVSSADLTEKDFSDSCEIAVNFAKIILIIGTSNEYFCRLLSEYSDKINDKIIIPIFSNMNTSELPDELSKLQAMNYDSISATETLVKIISNYIGKKEKIDIIKAQNAHITKNGSVIIFVGMIVFLAATFCIYIVFGTPYVLKSKKYEYAEKLVQNGNFIEAIDAFKNLNSYRDSTDRINYIYDKYNGFFSNENGDLTLYLYIDRNLVADIEVTYITDQNITVQFNTNAIVDKNTITFVYEDNLNNLGNGKIDIGNESIKLRLKTDVQDVFSIENIECVFPINYRTDAPLHKLITKDEVIGWVKNVTTKIDLAAENVKLEFIGNLSGEEIYLYRIQYTDYAVLFAWDDDKDSEIVGAYIPCVDLFPNDIIYNPIVDGDMIYVPVNIDIPHFFSYSSVVDYYDIPLCYVTSKKSLIHLFSNTNSGEEEWNRTVDGINRFNEYLFPSNSKYITETDLNGKSAEQVALIRNEIFARHGYIFTTEPYITYFNQKSWYVPNSSFDSSMLNSIEKANVDFITQYEKEKGYK